MNVLEIIQKKRPCQFCGKDFSKTPRALNSKTIHCSDSCKQQAYLERGDKMSADERLEKRHSYVKSHYGLTKEDYNRLLAQQDGCCAICGESESEINKKITHYKALSVDHDHKTKQVRGLLCSRCNIGLGNFKDNIKIMARAIQYLRPELQDMSYEGLLEFTKDLL